MATLSATPLRACIRASADRRRGAGPNGLDVSGFLLSYGFLAYVGNPPGGSGANSAPNLCAGNRRQILFFQNAPMMQFVSGGDVCKRAYGDFVFIRDAAALPGVAVQP